MKKSYLNRKNDIKSYEKKSSYIFNSFVDRTNEYKILPEQYDIFVNVEKHYFVDSETQQQQLISNCLNYMKKVILSIYNSQGIICVLPKINVQVSDENTVVFNWAYSTFRAYMTFENEKGNFDAFFGIIAKTDEYAIKSETKKIDLNNYKEVVTSAIVKMVEYC